MELKFLRSISWSEIFSIWEKGEAELPRWIEHYQKRGFTSWKEWRNNTIKDLRAEQLSWSLYEIINPLKEVPQFHAGPFRAWINKYYDKQRTFPFGTLAENPEIQNDQNIIEIIKSFPESSTVVGLKVKNDIVIIEGLHRCAALAVANEKGLNIKPRIYIACAEFPGELPLLGQENSPT